MNKYDVIVIGGGPAGLMAAASAAIQGAKVLLVEKGDRLGRKLIISGGGRCNVTNRKPFDQLIQHIPGNGRFLYSAFAEFGSEQIIQFFEGLGIPLKEEDNGRMFPVSDRASSVANALIERIRAMGVQIWLGSSVDRLRYAGGSCIGIRLKDGREVDAGATVIAVGGRSVPLTGSTGDGYDWAREAGHTITTLYPTEVPLTAGDSFIRDRSLQGLSLRAITQTLYDPKGKRVTTQPGDMLFTHFGLSGPASLRTSHYVSVTQMKHGKVPLRLTIDLFPAKRSEDVYLESLALAGREPKKAVKNVLKPLIPDRMIPLLLEMAGLPEGLTHAHIPRDRWAALSELIKGVPVTITGTLSIDEAFVTGGGVSVKEIDPKTMGSRLMPGLYFAGEVMDVHAHTGGYNITVAFSTGYVAGRCAAGHARDFCITGSPTT